MNLIWIQYHTLQNITDQLHWGSRKSPRVSPAGIEQPGAEIAETYCIEQPEIAADVEAFAVAAVVATAATPQNSINHFHI